MTVPIHSSVTIYHKRKELKLLAKCFIRKSMSRQLHIFNPVNCKQKLTGEMMKHKQDSTNPANGSLKHTLRLVELEQWFSSVFMQQPILQPNLT